MKHKGGCHCNQFSFQTDMDPMPFVQCNCKNCHRITGSIAIGCLYGATEMEFSGETNLYELGVVVALLMKFTFVPNVISEFLINQHQRLWKAW